MLQNSFVIAFLCFIAYTSAQTHTKLSFTDCGSKNVKISRFSYLPMPILQPGTGKVSFAIAANENIKGIIKADLKIVRTVSGIKLPVNCYKVEGENFGSCSYPDLCTLMKRIVKYEEGACPESLREHGIDCNCPVNISKRDLDIEMEVTMPKAPDYASWLSVGDFDVNVKATVGNLHACYDFKFAVRPQK